MAWNSSEFHTEAIDTVDLEQYGVGGSRLGLLTPAQMKIHI